MLLREEETHSSLYWGLWIVPKIPLSFRHRLALIGSF